MKIIQDALHLYPSRYLSESPIEKESQISETMSTEDRSAQVVKFRRFIPLHAAFLNQPTNPGYLQDVYTSKNSRGNPDFSKLGFDLKNILEIYIRKGKDEQAANILRNVICSGFLTESATVNEMKDIFINHINTEFQNSTLGYMDILIYFIKNEEQIDMEVSDKNTLVFQLFKDSINKALSQNSELIHRCRLEDNIIQTSDNLAKYQNSAALLDLFYFEVAKTVIKRKQFEYLHFINFACLTSEHALKLINKLVISKCYPEAIDLIMASDAQVERHIVFGLYKRLFDLKSKGLVKVSNEKIAAFENWMCNNGLDSVIGEIGAVGKGRREYQVYEWNELDNMK